VAAVAGLVQHGYALPGQALAAVQQKGLVGLDDQQVVGLLVGDQELGGLRVGLERVGGDYHIGQVEPVQQWLQAGDLAGGAVDLALGQHRAAGVVHTGQQVDLAAVVAGAAQRLAVHGHRPRPPRWLRSAVAVPVGEPGADGAGQGASGSRRARVRRMVASAGTAKWPGASRRAPSAARTGWGVSAAHSAIAVTDRAPARTAAAAMARMAMSEWRRPQAALGSGTVAR
jgi:hypothetical protein